MLYGLEANWLMSAFRTIALHFPLSSSSSSAAAAAAL